MAKTPTQAPTPRLQMKTSRCTQASKKNSIHLLMMNPTKHTSRLDAPDPPQPLPPRRLHPRKAQMGAGARQTLVCGGAT